MVRDHPAARDALAAKPRHGSDQKADSGGLFLIGQDLGLGKPCRIVDGDVSFFVARTAGAAKPPISRDLVAHSMTPSQLFDIDMDHVAGLGPFVSAPEPEAAGV
jgi:hypothetical protein